jgi:hypothetical protein
LLFDVDVQIQSTRWGAQKLRLVKPIRAHAALRFDASHVSCRFDSYSVVGLAAYQEVIAITAFSLGTASHLKVRMQ